MANEEQIEELQAEVYRLSARLKQLTKPKTKGKWRPEKGDKYFYIDYDAEVMHGRHNGLCVDERIIEIGNYYKTKEEAEHEVERLKAVERVLRVIDEVNGDWVQKWEKKAGFLGSMRGLNFFIKFNSFANRFEVINFSCLQQPKRHLIRGLAEAFKVIELCSKQDLKLFLGIE